jgi:O-antigen/teichoic acid export membrane protein
VTVSNAQPTRAASVLGWFGSDRLTGKVVWVAFPVAAQQLIRLAANIALTRLLAPEMFGIMLLINALRTGTELLSDIGIGQSIVRSSRAEERGFLDTAWTLQLLRGVLLAVVMVAAAGPMGELYDQPELTPLLIATSPIFLFTGLQSTALFIMQRNMRLRASAAYELGNVTFQSLLTIAIALVMPSVWALAWGMVGGTLFACIMSYVIGKGHRPKLTWDKPAAVEIIHFGKWIFLSTMVYFAAMSTDKFYFVAVLPLAMVGVYSIARTYADLFDQLAQRAGAMLIFPRFALLGDRHAEEAARLRRKRRSILALVALAIGAAAAGLDRLILLFYDARYHLAAFMLPVLLVGVWFRLLGSFADAMLMGRGRPAPGAFANGAKFAFMLIGLPLAMGQGNLFAALLVLVLAEIGRWAVVAPVLQRDGLATVADDLGLTALMLGSAIVLKLLAGAVGLVPSVAQWWSMGQALHG